MRKIVNFSPIAKPFHVKVSGVFLFRRCVVIFLLAVLVQFVQAQEKPVRAPAGVLPLKTDTARTPKPDTLSLPADSLKNQADSVSQARKGDIETTILYSARDSIISNLPDKIVKLYGQAAIKYGDIELKAEEIVIDYNLSTISANGKLDSTGRRVGFPIFKNGNETYETRDMVYNFKTRRAKISEVVTKQGDGFLHGETVFKNDKNELFSIGNEYTTCNLAHPHFVIRSVRSKAIPGDKIVSGPFYLEFNDVPTPFGFAFGMFPSQRKASSGIIFPTYGEERQRGFFLRGAGYFFDISDYVKLAITSDLYSRGSNALYANANYRKRYTHTGSFNFSVTNNRLTQNIEDNTKTRDFRLTWSHSPQSKGTGRFSASVNAASSTFNNNNFLGVNANPATTRLDNTTQNLSSNISYSKTFAGTPFTASVNLRHNQNVRTKQIDLPLPDVTFNMNNIYPFKKTSSEFLQNIAFRLSSTATNAITNNLGKIKRTDAATDSIAPFNFETLPTFLRNSKKGVRHSFPLATSVKVLRFFTLSPALSYDELWYFEKLNWGLNADGTAPVVKDTVNGFNRVANYSGGVGITTRIYGMVVSRNPQARIRAIRHIVNPTVSYSFQPDFADPRYGYFDTVRLKTNQVVYRSRHEGFVYGSSRQGRSSSMGFSINNSLEMKVRNPKDTVDKKIPIFNTLSLSSGYNLAADSFKLAPIGFSANTNILQDKINLNLTASIDPYQQRVVRVDEKGAVTSRRIDRYVWQDRFALGQITSANFAFSTNLNPKGRQKDVSTRDKIAKSNMSDADKQVLMNNPDLYVDFDIPWNIRFTYNLDYSKQGYQEARITQAIRFNGDVSLTQKWKILYNSGYDLQRKEFTITTLNISRELHCWQVSVGWTPFGRLQSYNFSIGVKSGMLRDLKLDRTRSFFDNL